MNNIYRIPKRIIIAILLILFPLNLCAQEAKSKGALSFYQLRGPVKSVIFEENDLIDMDIADSWSFLYYDITKVEFDRSGKVIFPHSNPFTYDSLGRLSHVNWEIDIPEEMFSVPQTAFYLAEDFKYDQNGNLLSYLQFLGFDRGITVTLRYNSIGDLVKYIEAYEVSYTVLRKDKWGNWLERRTSSGKIERRVLDYYE